MGVQDGLLKKMMSSKLELKIGIPLASTIKQSIPQVAHTTHQSPNTNISAQTVYTAGCSPARQLLQQPPYPLSIPIHLGLVYGKI